MPRLDRGGRLGDGLEARKALLQLGGVRHRTARERGEGGAHPAACGSGNPGDPRPFSLGREAELEVGRGRLRLVHPEPDLHLIGACGKNRQPPRGTLLSVPEGIARAGARHRPFEDPLQIGVGALPRRPRHPPLRGVEPRLHYVRRRRDGRRAFQPVGRGPQDGEPEEGRSGEARGGKDSGDLRRHRFSLRKWRPESHRSPAAVLQRLSIFATGR